MPRLTRYFVKDVPQHVILRGNNRAPIFANDEDCLFFRGVLLEAAERYGVRIHAYVFMTNHIHLLASPDGCESLPQTMQSLGRRYVQYFNYRYQRTGTLWEGRYRATVVDAEAYLFECMRYIELNPVRAGMCGHPGEFRWSSYGANAEGQADKLVTPHLLYLQLAATVEARKAAYRALVEMPMLAVVLDVVRNATNKGWALGGAQFAAEIEALSARRAAPLRKGRPKSKSG